MLLNGGEAVALVRSDGSFRFPSVLAGRTYTLDVALPAYDFPTIKVDVSGKAGSKGKLSAFTMPARQRAPLPLVLRPQARAVYFQAREPVNVFGMLKNPMVSRRSNARPASARAAAQCHASPCSTSADMCGGVCARAPLCRRVKC